MKKECDFYRVIPRPSVKGWDTSIDAAHLVFTGTATARKAAGVPNSWNATAVSSEDVDCFRMKVEYGSTGGVMVGIQLHPSGFVPFGNGYMGNTSYYLWVVQGTLYCSGKSNESFHGSQIQTGGIITGTYDREVHTISFSVDDSWSPKVAFGNVYASGLRAMCNFADNGASATFC